MMVTWIGIVLCALTPAPDAALFVRELAPGVFAMGSSHRHGAANLGCVIFEDHVMLIGAPNPDLLAECMAEVGRLTDKPIRGVILTHVRRGEREAARVLLEKGIDVVAQREAAKMVRDALEQTLRAADRPGAGRVREFTDRLQLHDGKQQLDVIALEPAMGHANAAVYLRGHEILFAGALCVNGPRAELPGSHTASWIRGLERLRELPCRAVVPGFGSLGGPSILSRQERFLRELRRQVGHLIAQGRSLDDVCSEVRIAPEWLVWMPYDHPTREDIGHVFRELTVPVAPYGDRPFSASDPRPKALALIGDRPHDPAHLEAGLALAFERAGMDARFAVDVHTLTAANLNAVKLLVILRDGMVWPDGPGKPGAAWMTPDQERAIVHFVEAGGGLLALHNATGLYPEGGPYLKLLGGTYKGHGPLETFRVKVVDRSHAVTRGVADYEVADEQHTPSPDLAKVHLLLESRSAEGILGAAGWAHEAGQGRVCYLANGHTREAMFHPEYQKLLQNAVRWCLKEP
ncbi:MAG TPA: ThuA domain-containing protein [Isosphaeraceae bacterium]|nr:ThuA domain-containing protein [Isosphaeraceae bacterium]